MKEVGPSVHAKAYKTEALTPATPALTNLVRESRDCLKAAASSVVFNFSELCEAFRSLCVQDAYRRHVSCHQQ